MSTTCCDMAHSKANPLNQDGDLSGVGSNRSSHIVNTCTIGAVLFPIGVFPMGVFPMGVFQMGLFQIGLFPIGLFPIGFFRVIYSAEWSLLVGLSVWVVFLLGGVHAGWCFFRWVVFLLGAFFSWVLFFSRCAVVSCCAVVSSCVFQIFRCVFQMCFFRCVFQMCGFAHVWFR